MCNAMKAGSYSAWLSTVAGQMLTVCTLQMMCVVRTRSAADVARELDIPGYCPELSGTNWITENFVHTECQKISQTMTKIVWDCMGLYE
jgi:hypothetical protein